MDSEQVPADVEVAEGCAANHVDNAGAVDSAGTSYTGEKVVSSAELGSSLMTVAAEEEKILLDIAQTSIAKYVS